MMSWLVQATLTDRTADKLMGKIGTDYHEQFGCYYIQEEVHIEPKEIIEVLLAYTMFGSMETEKDIQKGMQIL